MSRRITIGVLSPMTGGSYYGKILAGITREVAAVGGRVVLVQTLDAGLRSDEVVGAPDFVTPTAWEHIDGVISIATATQRNYLDRLQAAGKAVALASDVIDGFDAPSATPDNSTGVVATVDHLVWHGHTAIGFARQPRPTRHAGPVRGLPGRARGARDRSQPEVVLQRLRQRRARRSRRRPPTRRGRHCPSPHSCSQPIAMRSAAWRNSPSSASTVPGDVAIVGFDGLEDGTYTEPTLSTVRQPYDEIGAAAARLVLAQLRGDDVELRAHLSPSEFVPRGSCGCPGEDGAMATDGGAGFWRDEARMRFERATRRENSMREQYEISIQLLDHERADPRSLQWLAATDVRGACLALWDGDPSTGRLRIVGAYDPDDALPTWSGRRARVEQFPPASLIELADPEANEVTIVVPVKARGLDFGLLAVAGEVDALSANGRETHNQWAALLTAALEQQALLESVRTSEERYGLWAVATNDGLWDWDLTTDTIYYSGRCMRDARPRVPRCHALGRRCGSTPCIPTISTGSARSCASR